LPNDEDLHMTRNREQPPLGRRLVRLRYNSYLTQETLARGAGLSTAIVASLEQGLRRGTRG
jgi:transcriptional regulator with XRE-family HTH domain